jgi:PA14 domain
MKRRLLGFSVLLTSACSFQMHSGPSYGGTSTAAPEPKVEKSAHKSHGKGVSVSFHKSGSISGKIDWQGRSGQLCRATTPFKFVGLAKFHGTAQLTPSGVQASGTGSASGKTSGGASAGTCEAPRTPVPTPPPAVALKPHPEKPVATADAKPELHAKSDSKIIPETHSGSDSKTIPDSKPTPKPNKIDKTKPKEEPATAPTPTPVGPTPGQLEAPKSPPAEPPGNVFGYDEPVLGCFEGQVFPLAPSAPTLPTNYDTLTPVSVVYACEWNIAPRSWDQGFPGIADRFEWFAIRYAGAFHTSAAGEYDFRVSSDDGAKVTIDGKLVVDNDGQHAPKEARGKVQLAAGDHHMVLEYFQGPRYQINLQLWVTPPGKPEELFTVR